MTVGVTGNPIRAYTNPGGSDPLAAIVRLLGVVNHTLIKFCLARGIKA